MAKQIDIDTLLTFIEGAESRGYEDCPDHIDALIYSWDKGDCSLIGLLVVLLKQEISKDPESGCPNYDELREFFSPSNAKNEVQDGV